MDPANVMEVGDEFCPIYGSRQWDLLSEKQRDEPGVHLSSWLLSQFLHGEQGALTVAARIAQTVPDMDSKFYAATLGVRRRPGGRPRTGYLDSHIRATHDAVVAGVDVRGYLVWSLIDNFEWTEGYHQRFGLVHVDFATQQRTPKASYYWYRDLIAAQRS